MMLFIHLKLLPHESNTQDYGLNQVHHNKHAHFVKQMISRLHVTTTNRSDWQLPQG